MNQSTSPGPSSSTNIANTRTSSTDTHSSLPSTSNSSPESDATLANHNEPTLVPTSSSGSPQSTFPTLPSVSAASDMLTTGSTVPSGGMGDTSNSSSSTPTSTTPTKVSGTNQTSAADSVTSGSSSLSPPPLTISPTSTNLSVPLTTSSNPHVENGGFTSPTPPQRASSTSTALTSSTPAASLPSSKEKQTSSPDPRATSSTPTLSTLPVLTDANGDENRRSSPPNPSFASATTSSAGTDGGKGHHTSPPASDTLPTTFPVPSSSSHGQRGKQTPPSASNNHSNSSSSTLNTPTVSPTAPSDTQGGNGKHTTPSTSRLTAPSTMMTSPASPSGSHGGKGKHSSSSESSAPTPSAPSTPLIPTTSPTPTSPAALPTSPPVSQEGQTGPTSPLASLQPSSTSSPSVASRLPALSSLPMSSLTLTSSSGNIASSATTSTPPTTNHAHTAPENYAENTNTLPTTSGTSFTWVTLGTTNSLVTSQVTTSSGSSLVVVHVTTSVVVPLVTSVPVSPTSNQSRSDDGALIGGIVGGVVALLLFGLGLCLFLRRRRRATSHQLLRNDDLSTPLSAREAPSIQSFYSPVPHGQGGSYNPSQSFGSSAELQYPAALPYLRTTQAPGSPPIEHDPGSSDGYIPDDDSTGTSQSAGTETGTHFAAANDAVDGNLYATQGDAQTQSSVTVNSSQIGLAIGERASLPNSFYSVRSGQDLLTPTMSNDDDDSAYAPSPSEFPAPPLNPFLNDPSVARSPMKRSSDHGAGPGFAVNKKQAPSLRTWSMQEASWAAAVAAASPVQADKPIINNIPAFVFSLYAAKSDEKAGPIDVKSPDPSSNQPRSENPFVHVSYNGDGYDSERDEGNGSSADSHETYTAKDPDPFADQADPIMLSASSPVQDTRNMRRSRLSSASSGVEVPDNPSECGVAL